MKFSNVCQVIIKYAWTKVKKKAHGKKKKKNNIATPSSTSETRLMKLHIFPESRNILKRYVASK